MLQQVGFYFYVTNGATATEGSAGIQMFIFSPVGNSIMAYTLSSYKTILEITQK